MKTKALFFILCSIILNLSAQNSFIAGEYSSNDYYNEFYPNTTIQSKNYNHQDSLSIDLDYDGLNDLTFQIKSQGFDGPLGFFIEFIRIDSYNNCEFGVIREETHECGPPLLSIVNLLNKGDIIDSLITFKKMIWGIIYFKYQKAPSCIIEIYDWVNDTSNMFVPIKLNQKYGWVQIKTYYGWAYEKKLYVQNYAIQDFQYNSIENIQNETFNIFPNPSGGEIWITNINTNSAIVIYDSQGKVIFNLKNSDGDTKINLPYRGLYICKLINESSVTYKKIIIE